MKLGNASAFRGFAIFVIVFAALMVLKERGMPDVTGLAWWAFVLLASFYLAWKGWRHRGGAGQSRSPGGWGAVVPRKLWRWVLGEDEPRSGR